MGVVDLDAGALLAYDLLLLGNVLVSSPLMELILRLASAMSALMLGLDWRWL